MNYRSLWEQHFGPIPIDNEGRSYEIHHIDGDRNNNDLRNFQCVSIQEHYDIHWKQGDYFACAAISKRMALSADDRRKLSEAISKSNSQRIGELNGFYGKTHSDEFKKRHSIRMSGVNHPFYGKSRPEVAQAMSVALKDVPKTPEHAAQIRKRLQERAQTDPIRACFWIIEHNGYQFYVRNLKKFCRENDIVFSRLYRKKVYGDYRLIGKV